MIGYSVVFINGDTTVKDALWSKRIVYLTWERALDQATSMANQEKDKYGDDSYIISLVSSNSKNICESNGNAQVFTVQIKEYGKVGGIYIVTVYSE